MSSPPVAKMTNTPRLSDDILLLVAEHASLADISAMMMTNKNTNAQFLLYEKSIVKAKLLRYPDFLPPSGCVMTSESMARSVVTPYTFWTLSELDLRRRRIDIMFAPGSLFFQAVQGSTPFLGLPPHELDKVIAGFKRGCMLLDRIADCVPDITHRSNEAGLSTKKDPYPYIRLARKAQMAYIKHTLDKVDHAWMFELVSHAGMVYIRARPETERQLDAWEKSFAFKETLLREGSFALWALLGADKKKTATIHKDDDKPVGGHRQFTQLLAAIMDNIEVETKVWETGANLHADNIAYEKHCEDQEQDIAKALKLDDNDNGGMLPSLHSVMMSSFSDKTGYERGRGGTEADFLVLSDIRKTKG